MRIEIHFTHMDRSDALEVHATEKMTKVVSDYLNRQECHLQVWLVNEHSKNQKGAPQYKCEACLRFPPKREIFVRKSSEDMYDSINMAASALQQILREESKKGQERR